MPYVNPLSAQSLVSVLRTPPTIDPDDSVQRFIELIAHTPYSMLPVVKNGQFEGYVGQSDVLFLLSIEDIVERQAASLAPVGQYMPGGSSHIVSGISIADASKIFGATGLEMLAVLDTNGEYLGAVMSRDLLTGIRQHVRLPTIGGMATPLGVYLSDGSLQAGASNFALMLSGAVLAAAYIGATLIVQGGIDLTSRLTHHNLGAYSPDYIAPPGQIGPGLIAVTLHLVTTLVFLLLMRSSRIAGYHAAEHQTVHAIERGEPLAPEVVQRMPRPHPRCGTNLLAAGILFYNLAGIFKALPGFDAESASFFAVLVTLVTWRRFGWFLQAAFTTRPARPKEIESGISAAASLIVQYEMAPPHRSGRRTFRRIWCSGMIQSLLGMMPTMWILMLLLSKWLK